MTNAGRPSAGSYDHGEVVLRGIVSGGRDRILRALLRLAPEHFIGDQRSLFSLLTKYYSDYGKVPRAEVLGDMLRRAGADVAKQILAEERLRELEREPPADDEFRYALDALVDARQHDLTGEAITTAMEILEGGAEIDREMVRGHESARTYAYRAFAEIDRLGGREESPQGLLHEEADALRKRYADAKASPTPNGILSGFPSLDGVTGGFRNGELVLVCGTAAAGKSMFVTQVAWRAAIDGKNFAFFTIENVRQQVINRILARHSKHISGGQGLNSSLIRDGRLNEAGEKLHERTVRDIEEGTASGRYGNMYIAQVPHGTTPGVIEARVRWLEQLWRVDLVVIDYLVLLRPDRRRPTKREELNDILQEVKLMAVSLAGGRGVPVLSPWQVNRVGHKEANRIGEYLLQDLAETSEAERTADQVISLLNLPLDADLRLQVLKNRDGPIPPAIRLNQDLRSSCLEENQVSATLRDILDDGDL